MIKARKLTIMQQYGALKRDYGHGSIKLVGDRLTWTGILKSSPIGDEYLIKVFFKEKGIPKIFVLEPKHLLLAEGLNKLVHVYNQDTQRLCLYYPDGKEWNGTKTIASTIIPWTIEWLYHYEIWLITGEWEGGGVHSEIPKEDN